MKSIIKYLLIFIVAVILLLWLLPYAFKGKITSVVRQQVNENLNAEFSFQDVSISLFSAFPDLNVKMEKVMLKGKDRFSNDTLFSTDLFSIDVDLSSLLSDTLIVNNLSFNKTRINAIALNDSLVNWDIVKESESSGNSGSTDEESTAFKINRFELLNTQLIYFDKQASMKFILYNLDLFLTGNFSGNQSSLSIQSKAEKVSYYLENTAYLKNVALSYHGSVAADFDAEEYSFKDNQLSINDLPLLLNGSTKLYDDKIFVNLILSSQNSDLKTLLKLIPESYRKDYDQLQTEGSFSFRFKIKGDYIDEDHLPFFDLSLKVNNGLISYSDMPESMEAIRLVCSVHHPKGSMDQMMINVPVFKFRLGSNPFEASLSVLNPVSDPAFDMRAKGKIDLTTLKKVIPLENQSLKGLLTADITMKGKYSMIEKEQYHRLKSDGSLQINNLYYSDKQFPDGVAISKALMNFTPEYLNLKQFDCQIGQSDFHLNGKVKNYLAYALTKNGVLIGNLNFSSHYINADEFLTDEEPPSEQTENSSTSETQPVSQVMEVPKNLNFTLTTKIDRLLYDDLTINNIQGKIRLKDGKAYLDHLNMNMLEGKAALSGLYDPTDLLSPQIVLTTNMSNIDLNKAAQTIESLDSLFPLARYANGKVSFNLDMNSKVKKDFSPVLSTLNASGSFHANQLLIKDAPIQKKLAVILKESRLSQTKARNLKVSYKIVNGQIEIKPFDLNILNKKVHIEGKQGLDKSINYHIIWPFSGEEIAKVAGLKGIKVPKMEKEIPVKINIKGKFDQPKISLDLEDAKKELLKEVGKKAGKTIDDLLKDKNVKDAFDGFKKKFGGG